MDAEEQFVGGPDSGDKQHIPLPMSLSMFSYHTCSLAKDILYPDDFGGVPANLCADIITLRPDIIQPCSTVSSCQCYGFQLITTLVSHSFMMHFTLCSTLGHTVLISLAVTGNLSKDSCTAHTLFCSKKT